MEVRLGSLGSGSPKPPTTRQLIAIIRSLVTDPNIIILQHAFDRMSERGIKINEMKRVLRLGDIVGPIVAGRTNDEWTCKVVHAPRYPSVRREIGVVTIVVREQLLLIKTVEWELKP